MDIKTQFPPFPMKSNLLSSSLSTTKAVLRGRLFTISEINLINKVVSSPNCSGITDASKQICEAIGWRQFNGKTKDRACRDVLREMKVRGLITRHFPKASKKNKKLKNKICRPGLECGQKRINKLDLSSIHLVLVSNTGDNKLWNSIIEKYHYLGFNSFVGRSLKYLIYQRSRLVGAIGFCDPAWSISPRDKILKSMGFDLNKIRIHGINNGRFLILPWIKVPNLASFILSNATKKVKQDWKIRYGVEPIYIETFVNSELYSGTCYKAANWIYAGKTRGFKKQGKSHSNNQVPKKIFIYACASRLKARFLRLDLENSNALSN